MSAHIFAFCLSLLLAKKWVFPRQIFLFIFFFFWDLHAPSVISGLIAVPVDPEKPLPYFLLVLYIFIFFPLHFEGESIYCFFRFILFFFLPDFTLRAWRTLTLLRAITCYWSPPTAHSICLTFKPFDTHIVAANVQVRMCWFKRFFFWEINSLLINNTHLFTNQIIHLSWHFF